MPSANPLQYIPRTDCHHGGFTVDLGTWTQDSSRRTPQLTPEQAHDHARAASVATQSADTTVAINEHALAAGEFAQAAAGTGSVEALRTLRLLEQHHQRLSELLRYPAEHPVTAPTDTDAEVKIDRPLSTSAAVAELRASKSDLGPRALSPLRRSTISTPRRLPPRDLSSSIASNLASARGIRSNYTRQPLSPSISRDQAPGSLDIAPRNRESRRKTIPASIPEHPSKPSWIPPHKSEAQTGTSRASAVAEHVPAQDEGFSRFYSAFGGLGGLISRLSAPLAFAGLPLSSDEPEASVPEVPKAKPKSRDRSDAEPDLNKYFSRASLRATARDGRGASDSFYVVPSTGHTASYAQILSFAEKEKRRLAASLHAEQGEFAEYEEDEYVDARETPMTSPPRSFSKGKPRSSKKTSEREMENKIEELAMENRSLKDCVDKLSSRLHAFEMSAQNSSMALQESMRLLRPEGDGSDDHLRRRILDLEDVVLKGRKENEKISRENQKIMSLLEKYRERWEKLKLSAKARTEGGGKEGSGAAAHASPQPAKDATGGRFVVG